MNKQFSGEPGGILLLEPSFRFHDHRGEMFDLTEHGWKFVKDSFSLSHQNVLRGIHVETRDCWKLATSVHGNIYTVVVDCRTEAETFGQWKGFYLDDYSRRAVLVPPRFGLAHLVLSKTAIFYYRWTMEYHRESQLTYRWNEPKFNIEWPLRFGAGPILSERDKNAPRIVKEDVRLHETI